MKLGTNHLHRPHTGAKVFGYLGVGVAVGWAGVMLARRRTQPRRALASKPVRRAITIAVPPEQVYAFWRDVENLPSFMSRLVSIEELGPRRSLWHMRAPAGKLVEWEAEITEDVPGSVIGWRSLPGAVIRHQGRVWFRPAPGSRGTEVSLELQYEAPAGELGRWVASFTRPAAGVEIENDLRRLKQILEVGEVVCSDASAHRGLHPARPEPLATLAQKEGQP